MKKIQEVLKNKSGQGVPMILAVVLCCLILACVTFEYMRLMIVAQGVRDSVQSATVDVAPRIGMKPMPVCVRVTPVAINLPVRPGHRMLPAAMYTPACKMFWALNTRAGSM